MNEKNEASDSARSVLFVGSGGLANALASLWQPPEDWSLHGMRRHTENLHPALQAVKGSYLDRPQLAAALSVLRPDYLVMTITPPAYTAEAYRQSYQAAVENVLATLDYTPRRIVFVSSTSVYGQSDGSVVDEQSSANADSFSADTMRRCEQFLADSEIASTALRCGGIYSPDSGRMLAKIARAEFSTSTAFTNRIHQHDCARAIGHLLQCEQSQPLQDCYLLVDNEPCRRVELEQWLAERLNVTYRKPEDEQDESSRQGTADGKRCSNQRLLQTGFGFLYPGYREGYGAIIARREQ